MDWLRFFVVYGGSLRRDRHHVPHLRSSGVLRCWAARSRSLQRDGDSRGLDVGRFFYWSCRDALLVWL